jgi:hypothetical protein
MAARKDLAYLLIPVFTLQIFSNANHFHRLKESSLEF